MSSGFDGFAPAGCGDFVEIEAEADVRILRDEVEGEIAGSVEAPGVDGDGVDLCSAGQVFQKVR